jgi:hypothetical protein
MYEDTHERLTHAGLKAGMVMAGREWLAVHGGNDTVDRWRLKNVMEILYRKSILKNTSSWPGAFSMTNRVDVWEVEMTYVKDTL